ncbi:hypothetical protein C8A05DRAFT_34134, partial [Staphylotrichum tortipilum]
MSGRSAYVRKKGTEAKPGLRGRAKSSSSSDNATINEYPVGSMPSPRLDHARRRERDVMGGEVMAYHTVASHYPMAAGGGLGGPVHDGGRDQPTTSQMYRPAAVDPAYTYARPRRPTLNTDDISGIEKSGLRSALDKKSDDVRKGLAKAFAFKKKGKKEDEPNFRPESSATVRPGQATGARPQAQADEHDGTMTPAPFRGGPRDPGPQPYEPPDMALPQPPTLLKTVPANTAPLIKRWVGAGRPVQRWNKLRKDPELWDPNGDVLVYLGRNDQGPPPHPSFRLSSHIIEATESRYLITLLREGTTDESIHMPPSPMGATPMLQRPAPHGGQQYLSPGGYGRGGQPTPPGSEDSNLWEMDGQISYEMYLPAPATLSAIDQLRYHLTTRNVFALLYQTSLVGLSLHQALTDLHARLETYMPPRLDNAGMVVNYLSARGIDDVRNDAEAAVGLLAWSEGREVRWEDGWRESFLHCAGMYAQLEACPDFGMATPITRALLERANLETQLRVQAAEERLATFQYGDMWPAAAAISPTASGNVAVSPAKAAMDRLQLFFVQYYTQEIGAWPPPSTDPVTGASGFGGGGYEDIWLTRTLAQQLQKDFAALYDYLVNRDIAWDESEARSSRKWMMVSESGNRGFEADTPDLPVTDMLIEFDNKHRFPHIPYPYPLVPNSIPPLSSSGSSGKEGSSGGIFNKASKKSTPTIAGLGGNAKAGSVERRVQLAYTEATNICILGSEFTHSNLVDAFTKFEKADQIGEVDPSTARRGRWVLLYGILQTLASVSVDSPTIRYRDDVAYHLSPRLKGVKLPPWKTPPNPLRSDAAHDAAHELSHCWTIPSTWHAGGTDHSASGTEDSAEESGGISPTSSAAHRYPPPHHNHNFHIPRNHSLPRGGGGWPSSRSTMTTSSRAPSMMSGPSRAPSIMSASTRAPSALGSASMYTAHGSVTTTTSAPSIMSSYSGSDAGSSIRPGSSHTRSGRRSNREG